MSRIQTHKIASFCFVYHQNNEGYAVFLQGFSFNKHAAASKTPKGRIYKNAPNHEYFHIMNIMNRLDNSVLISRRYNCQIDQVIPQFLSEKRDSIFGSDHLPQTICDSCILDAGRHGSTTSATIHEDPPSLLVLVVS